MSQTAYRRCSLLLLLTFFSINFLYCSVNAQDSLGVGEPDAFRFSGEYGLWVEEDHGEIEVHWVTATTDSGFLKVLQSGKPLHQFTTEPSLTHTVAFEKPGGSDFVIRYGGHGNSSDRHETVIQLTAKRPKAIWGKVDSVYVLGDLHGEFNHLVELLQNARLIDGNYNWTARKKHVVFLGDIFDRGIHVTRTLWFLYKLERQAELAGGRVHIVLGNHEIMTFGNDLRYLAPKERLVSHLHRIAYSKMYDVHDSVLGRWLATKPGLIKIDKTLFAHGGVAPPFTSFSISAFNDSLITFLHEDTFQHLLQDSIPASVDSLSFLRRQQFFYAENSVFWNRDYVLSAGLDKDLKKALKKHKCKAQVVAHTTVKTISEFYDGKILAVDLREPATEMLLLVRKGKHKRFRIKLDGTVEKLQRAKKAATMP